MTDSTTERPPAAPTRTTGDLTEAAVPGALTVDDEGPVLRAPERAETVVAVEVLR